MLKQKQRRKKGEEGDEERKEVRKDKVVKETGRRY